MKEIEVIKQASRLIILIPGENVLLANARLPKTSRSQLRQAIPYALEEQLSDDVEDCFFAHGEMNEQGNIPVLVINKNYFESILELIRERNLQPDAIIPDFLALPYEQDTWVLHNKDALVSVRTGEYSGFTIEADTLQSMLNACEDKPKLKNIDTDLCSLDIQVFINLLQGPYQTKRQTAKVSTRWRRCAYAFSVMIAMLFLSNFIQYSYFKYQGNKLHEQILITYKQVFPNEPEVLEPRFHTEAVLKRLSRIAGSNYFINVLEKAGAVLKRYPSIKITTLHFDHQKLELTLRAKNPAALNPLVTALSKQGLQVQQKQFQLMIREKKA